MTGMCLLFTLGTPICQKWCANLSKTVFAVYVLYISFGVTVLSKIKSIWHLCCTDLVCLLFEHLQVKICSGGAFLRIITMRKRVGYPFSTRWVPVRYPLPQDKRVPLFVSYVGSLRSEYPKYPLFSRKQSQMCVCGVCAYDPSCAIIYVCIIMIKIKNNIYVILRKHWVLRVLPI